MNRLTVVPVTFIVLFLAALGPAASAGASVASGQADAVWGQPSFTSGGCVLSGVSGSTLCHPLRTLIDDRGNLWVSDWFNNRVLMYAYDPATGAPSATPSKVFGQYGQLTTRGCDQAPPDGTYPAAPSQYTLCAPNGLAMDHRGTLYVADQFNHRVLVYFRAWTKPASEPADLVLGQSTFSSVDANDTPAGGVAPFVCASPAPASACSLDSPEGLTVDARGDLLVADTSNNRVLLWNARTLYTVRPNACATSCFIPATGVWGQYGSFNTNCPNEPGPGVVQCPAYPQPPSPASSVTLQGPDDVFADTRENLYIADTFNNRVLEYDGAINSGRQDATLIYGQGNDPTANQPNNGGVSATSLFSPGSVTMDCRNRLWITDSGNNRVLGYPVPSSANPDTSTTAITVLGQRGSFSTGDSNNGGLDAGSLDGPSDISFDRFGDAFVADHGNNDRILEYTGSCT